MKIDLCKLFGVEEGEEFKIELSKVYISGFIYRVKGNKLEWTENKTDFYQTTLLLNDVVNITKVIKLPKKKEFSQETLNFFKCINKKYKWIAKDVNDDVHTFCEKPIKESRYWFCDGCFYISKAFNQAIFNQILWEDEEPIRIDDYVDRK